MSKADELREQLRGAKIYVVPYSHSDWAWTYTRQWHEERYTNDVIIGYSQLPQIIRKAGYKYYWTTRPCAGLDQKGIPREFWWEGIDGTRLLCARGSYGGLASTDYLDEDWESAFVRLVENEILPRMRLSQTKHVWLARGADDIRPLRTGNGRPLDIIGLAQKWNQLESIPMKFATPLDYFRDLEELGDRIPVVKGIVDAVGWSYWYGQIGNESLRGWRVKSDEMLLTAEKLSAILEGKNTSLENELNKLWWDMLTTCPHATLWLFEEDYQRMLRKLHRVYFDAQTIVEDSLRALADKIDAKGDGEPIVVFNPLSWDRVDNLVVHKSFPKRGTRSVKITNHEGKIVPHQLLSPEPYEDGALKESDIVFMADAPSLGYATFYLTEIDESDEAGYGIEPKELLAMENDILKLTFDGGRLISVYDKETRVEHINADEFCAADLRFHAIEDTGPYHFGPVIDTLKMEVQRPQLLEDGTVRSRAQILGNIGKHQIEQDITLYKNSRRVDFVTRIESAGGDGFFRVYFPIAYDGKIVGDVPFGVEERDVTKEPYGTLERHRENVFYASHWADYFTEEHGVALFIEGGVPNATQPEYKSFLSVKPENVVLSAFYQDSDALTLRLYETCGTSAEAEVILPFAPKNVTATNFLGEPSETDSAIQLQKNAVKFQIKPWEIVTLSIATD